MASIRAMLTPRFPALLTLLFVPFLATGCDLIGSNATETQVDEPQSVNMGACLPTYSSEVVSADMSADGSRVVYISDRRPGTLPEEQSWGRDDRALMVLQLDGDAGATSRHIATSWNAVDSIQPYATERPGQEAQSIELPEEMLEVQVDSAGASFVVAVRRLGRTGLYSKLYAGAIPAVGEGSDLRPDEDGGLSQIEIVSDSGVEGIVDYWLSPDGSKVAALVGSQSELRVYDLGAASNNLYVYERNEDGGITVSHDLPEAMTSIEKGREPAIASRGLLRAAWAPDSNRLAIVQSQGSQAVGQSALSILDVATGQMELVREYKNSTAPQATWSSDGNSMWVMNTPLRGSTSGRTVISTSAFGDSQIHKVEAKAKGRDMGTGAKLPRRAGWKTDPGSLVELSGNSIAYIWENRVYRLDAPGGDLTKAQADYLLLRAEVPGDVRVEPSVLRAAPDADRLMFMVRDSAGMHVALRESASEVGCPLDPTTQEEAPADAEAPAEGEAPAADEAPAEDEAPADGEGESEDSEG